MKYLMTILSDMIKVNPVTGDTIVRQRYVTQSEIHKYRGNFECIGNKWRLHTETGFYDLSSNQNHYYIKDNQGSIVTVVSENGSIEEQTAYYPTGVPYRIFDRKSVTARKHIGNEWLAFNGLNTYDNTARYHYPIIPSYDTIDPNAEDYPGISPYAHCAGNPRNVIDPSGRKIVLDSLSEEDKKLFNSALEYLKQSKLFSIACTELENSEQEYVVEYYKGRDNDVQNKTDKSKKSDEDNAMAYFKPDEKGGKIGLKHGVDNQQVAEELFHAYQEENKSLYGTGSFNREFEAKLLAMMSALEIGGTVGVNGVFDFSNDISSGKYNNSLFGTIPNIENLGQFLQDYDKGCNTFVEYNIKNKVGNENYKIFSKIPPASLINLLKKYSK